MSRKFSDFGLKIFGSVFKTEFCVSRGTFRAKKKSKYFQFFLLRNLSKKVSADLSKLHSTCSEEPLQRLILLKNFAVRSQTWQIGKSPEKKSTSKQFKNGKIFAQKRLKAVENQNSSEYVIVTKFRYKLQKNKTLCSFRYKSAHIVDRFYYNISQLPLKGLWKTFVLLFSNHANPNFGSCNK